MKTTLATAALLSLTPCALAQDLGIKAPPQTQTIIITGAAIHPISGPDIANGYLVFDKGVITALGEGAPPAPSADTKQIDARGQHVYPGLFGAYTQLGLDEIGALRPSKDMTEAGGVTPETVAATAVNPDSWLMPVTRINGILLAGVFPTGGTIPGRASVIRMDGWTSEDMTVRRDCGLILNWPMMRIVRARWMDTPEEEQLKNTRASLERIRDTFRTAAAYSARHASDPTTPTDLRWEAMKSVFPNKPAASESGDKPGTPASPVFVSANDYDQIVAAVELRKQYGLRLVIVGGLDAPQCADLLKREDIPVIVTGVMQLPRRDDLPYDANYGLPKRLHEAGVKFCIASGEETPHERNLPYAAAMACAHGLPHDQALRSVTLSPAEIMGVSDKYGSLETGKSATLIITTGDPLEVSTQTTKAFIDGRLIDLSNKQTDLAKKYRAKYIQQKAAEKK